jgi:hypothetical protein
MTYYAGLDVSLRSSNICLIDDDGKRISARCWLRHRFIGQPARLILNPQSTAVILPQTTTRADFGH